MCTKFEKSQFLQCHWFRNYSNITIIRENQSNISANSKPVKTGVILISLMKKPRVENLMTVSLFTLLCEQIDLWRVNMLWELWEGQLFVHGRLSSCPVLKSLVRENSQSGPSRKFYLMNIYESWKSTENLLKVHFQCPKTNGFHATKKNKNSRFIETGSFKSLKI
jgi:hypothetical protein